MTTFPTPVDELHPGERPASLGDTLLIGLYRGMMRIRAFELEVVDAFSHGLIAGSTHPCIGQEAIKVGSIGVIHPTDLVLATYRGHGEAIAKGVDLVAIMAELMSRVTGVCKGRGGS